MSGINLDALNDEQWDELIAGCRASRAMRERYLERNQHSAIYNDSIPAVTRLEDVDSGPVQIPKRPASKMEFP